MFHMQERQLPLSLLFKKPIRNAVRRFSFLSDSSWWSYDPISDLSIVANENLESKISKETLQLGS